MNVQDMIFFVLQAFSLQIKYDQRLSYDSTGYFCMNEPLYVGRACESRTTDLDGRPYKINR